MFSRIRHCIYRIYRIRSQFISTHTFSHIEAYISVDGSLTFVSSLVNTFPFVIINPFNEATDLTYTVLLEFYTLNT